MKIVADNNLKALKYDPDGNRVYKESTVASTTTKRKYIVDRVGDLPVILLELDPMSNYAIKKTYIYGNSQILAQHDGAFNAPRYFYLHDRLGSVRLVIDSSGYVKNRYTYNPFGELHTTETEENILNPFKYTGQYFDSETGLYYFINRIYEPYLGRFTSYDPIFGKFEQPLTLHKYLYCRNDPVNWCDPIGLYQIKYYDETQEIIRDCTSLVGELPSGPIKAFGPGGDYDFKERWPTAEFEVYKNQTPFSASDFGNYLAGYSTYYNWLVPGEVGARLFGHIYQHAQFVLDLTNGRMPQSFDDDYGSRFFITEGALDANLRRKDEHTRGTLGTIDEIRLQSFLIYYWVMMPDYLDKLDYILGE